MQLRNYLSPYFLARYYINNTLKKISSSYSFVGKTVDIGCGEKPYKNYFLNTEYIGIDFKNYSVNKDQGSSPPDLYFPDSYLESYILPFGSDSFENTLAFQVIEHHVEPLLFLKELVRITKPGGKVVITAPFLAGLHEIPTDYTRFTEYFIHTFAEQNNCKLLLFEKQGAIFSTIAMLLNESISAFAAQNNFNYLISVVIYPFFLINSYLALILDIIFKSKNIYFNYLVMLEKN